MPAFVVPVSPIAVCFLVTESPRQPGLYRQASILSGRNSPSRTSLRRQLRLFHRPESVILSPLRRTKDPRLHFRAEYRPFHGPPTGPAATPPIPLASMRYECCGRTPPRPSHRAPFCSQDNVPRRLIIVAGLG